MITVDMISQANSTLNSLILTKWLTQELFSIRWWGIVAFLVFSYMLCIYLLNKRRLVELLLYGSLISVFAVIADVIVSNRNLFLYNIHLLPMIPSIFIYDITAVPLYFMLIYQYTQSWRQYALWTTLASAVMGFVLTPLLVALNYLRFIDWSYFNAFLIILAVGIMGKATMSLIFYVQDKYQTTPQTTPQLSLLQPALKPSSHKSPEDEE